MQVPSNLPEIFSMSVKVSEFHMGSWNSVQTGKYSQGKIYHFENTQQDYAKLWETMAIKELLTLSHKQSSVEQAFLRTVTICKLSQKEFLTST